MPGAFALYECDDGIAWIHGVFFFFQAEDGIRDTSVTGVQTCALPIERSLLLRSTASPSARVIVPTPAAARYSAAGEPSPPAPITSAEDASSFSCPSTPISGSRICLE